MSRRNPSWRWVVWGAAAGLITWYYRDERRKALARLSVGSRLVKTALGDVEIGESGEGQPLLVLHGGGAGYDGGLAAVWPELGYRVIAPSRPGYLRTPLESGRSFEQQADLFAALLDSLEIKKTAVWAMSGGGPAALQFALRHPKRCRGLVLLSAINTATPPYPLPMRIAAKFGEMCDFLPWLMMNTPLNLLLAGPDFLSQCAGQPAKMDLYRRTMNSMFPMSLRAKGVRNDLFWIKRLVQMPLENIKAPTLVIHGDHDSVVPFIQGLNSAEGIPHAQLRIIPGGDHLCLITHMEPVREEIKKFLDQLPK